MQDELDKLVMGGGAFSGFLHLKAKPANPVTSLISLDSCETSCAWAWPDGLLRYHFFHYVVDGWTCAEVFGACHTALDPTVEQKVRLGRAPR